MTVTTDIKAPAGLTPNMQPTQRSEDLPSSRKVLTPLQLYIREVSLAGKLLTAAQEIELGRSIQGEKLKITKILFQSPIVQKYAVSFARESGAVAENDPVLNIDRENIVAGMTELLERLAAHDRKPGSNLRAKKEKLLETFEQTLIEAQKELFKSIEHFHAATKLSNVTGIELLSSDLSNLSLNMSLTLTDDILPEIEESRANLKTWREKYNIEPSDLLNSITYIAGHRELRQTLMGHFVEKNLRLVISIAAQYGRKDDELLDLIGAGNTGAFDAADRFDPERGVRFSTFASNWIKRAIHQFLFDTQRTIKIPRYMHQQVLWYSRALNSLAAEQPGARVTPEQIKAEMNRLAKARGSTVKPVSLKGVVACEQLPSALPFSQKGNGSDERSEMPHEDPAALSPDSAVTFSSRIRLVAGIMSTLNPICSRILISRLAQSKDDEETLESIGRSFGKNDKPMCKERVRQIQNALVNIFSGLAELETYRPAQRAAAMQALREDLRRDVNQDPLLPINPLIGNDGKLVENEFLDDSFTRFKYVPVGYIDSPEKTAIQIGQLLVKARHLERMANGPRG